ncbi:MAG: methyltransferase domain-containing protein, partial [Candidatus Omnitrophota bacterium]
FIPRPLTLKSVFYDWNKPSMPIYRDVLDYDATIREYFPTGSADDGIMGLVEEYVEKNGREGRSTKYLDACGGMGLVPTEATVKYGSRGLQAYVVDAKKWSRGSLRDVALNLMDSRAKKRGIYDIFSRNFNFIKGDVTDVTLPEKMDVITSFHSLQYLNDPLRAIINLYNNLSDDGGILLANYFVPARHAEALKSFRTFLDDLSAFGVEVHYKETYIKDDSAYMFAFTVSRKNMPNFEINMVPSRVGTGIVVDRVAKMQEKAVYYSKVDSGLLSVVPVKETGSGLRRSVILPSVDLIASGGVMFMLGSLFHAVRSFIFA